MLNVVIFGAPGSGKGTQSELIIKEYGLDHISTGDVLRAEMKGETELGKIAKDYIEKGQLVPDELIVDMLAKVLDSKASSKGVIFDGFPRTIPQAKALKEMLNKRGTDVSVMLNLQVEEEELISRLLERGKVSGRSKQSNRDWMFITNRQHLWQITMWEKANTSVSTEWVQSKKSSIVSKKRSIICKLNNVPICQ